MYASNENSIEKIIFKAWIFRYEWSKIVGEFLVGKGKFKRKAPLKRIIIERGKTFDRVPILIFNVWTHNVEEAFDNVEEGESENKLY